MLIFIQQKYFCVEDNFFCCRLHSFSKACIYRTWKMLPIKKSKNRSQSGTTQIFSHITQKGNNLELVHIKKLCHLLKTSAVYIELLHIEKGLSIFIDFSNSFCQLLITSSQDLQLDMDEYCFFKARWFQKRWTLTRHVAIYWWQIEITLNCK